MTKQDLLVDGVATIVSAIFDAKEKQADEQPEVHEETLGEVLLQLAFAAHQFMKIAENGAGDPEQDVFTTLDEMNRMCRTHMALQIYEQANDSKGDAQ